jgi:hypothetical protein
MNEPSNARELLALFVDPDDRDYKDHVFLQDTPIGFSIQRYYPSDIRFKPAKGPKGDDDVAVIWVVYGTSKQTQSPDLVPLRLRIATLSKFRALHWDYNFKHDDSPTEESVIQSRRSPKPMDLSANNEFYFSKKTGGFVDSNGTPIGGRRILDRLFQYHCDSIHPIKGLRWQAPYKLSISARQFLDGATSALKYILEVVFGRTIDEHQNLSAFLNGYEWKDLKKVSVDSLEIAGYRAAKRVVVMFIAIVIFGCLILLPPKENTYFASLLNSEFLLAIHSLGLLLVLDELLPNIFFLMLNSSIWLRRALINSSLKRSGL